MWLTVTLERIFARVSIDSFVHKNANCLPCEIQLIRHRHIKPIKLETLRNQTHRQYGSAKQYIFSSFKKI